MVQGEDESGGKDGGEEATEHGQGVYLGSVFGTEGVDNGCWEHTEDSTNYTIVKLDQNEVEGWDLERMVDNRPNHKLYAN